MFLRASQGANKAEGTSIENWPGMLTSAVPCVQHKHLHFEASNSHRIAHDYSESFNLQHFDLNRSVVAVLYNFNAINCSCLPDIIDLGLHFLLHVAKIPCVILLELGVLRRADLSTTRIDSITAEQTSESHPDVVLELHAVESAEGYNNILAFPAELNLEVRNVPSGLFYATDEQ